MVSYDEILLALREGDEKRPDLADALQLYGALLEAEARIAMEPGPAAALDKEQASRRLDEGRALLSPEQVQVDAGKLANLLAEIGFTIARHRRELINPLAKIHALLHKQREHMGELAVEYLREGRLQEAEKAGLPWELVSLVFREALRPFLRAQAEALAPLVDDAGWYRGYCPICGGEPDIAALEKGSGRRRLLCSRCDSEWTFRRVGCPFCGNEEPAQLAHYPSDDKGYRLSVCEGCGRYLKTIDLREVVGEHPLAAERILTAGMDVAAERMGYRAET
jgi:formate dehydrogenase maturation protein FdhE